MIEWLDGWVAGNQSLFKGLLWAVKKDKYKKKERERKKDRKKDRKDKKAIERWKQRDG